jgi:hypothetical protein
MMQNILTRENDFPEMACSGYCARCGEEHSLPQGPAIDYCLELMREMEGKKRIDLLASDQEADPRFSIDYLFGKARGHMFGGMVYRDANGTLGSMPAFSGQYNSVWEVDGWAPPLFDVREFETLCGDVERTVKEHGRQIEKLAVDDPSRKLLVRKRKSMSQDLMKEIHSMYKLKNFRGKTRPLVELFQGNNGIPSGTGACCAPKLLNYAAQNNLTPLGIAEFYWGRENKSASRHHGCFYQSCTTKCRPILGFMLCGLDAL